MKRMIKSVVRSGWRLTGPIRRPLGRKLDSKLTHAVAIVVDSIVREQIQAQIHPRLDGLDLNVWQGRGEANAHATEVNLTLDSLVREIGRLQMQIESLQDLLAEREATGEGLSVVDGAYLDDFPGDRAKVG